MTSFRDDLRKVMAKQAQARRDQNAIPRVPSQAHPKLEFLDRGTNEPLLQPWILLVLAIYWVLEKAWRLLKQLGWAIVHTYVSGR